MISGTVRNREAIIKLDVFGTGKRRRQIKAVIDTGFNGYLTLSRDLVAALRLRFAGYRRATLADGTTARLEAYLTRVEWHGRRMDVLIAQGAGTALVGMSLLEGSRLTMDVAEGGSVSIDESP